MTGEKSPALRGRLYGPIWNSRWPVLHNSDLVSSELRKHPEVIWAARGRSIPLFYQGGNTCQINVYNRRNYWHEMRAILLKTRNWSYNPYQLSNKNSQQKSQRNRQDQDHLTPFLAPSMAFLERQVVCRVLQLFIHTGSSENRPRRHPEQCL